MTANRLRGDSQGSVSVDGASSPTRCTEIVVATLLIWLACIATYSNSFHGVFLLDDAAHFVASRPDNWYADSLLVTRPLVHLTIWTNFEMLGPELWGFHAVNLFVHLLSAALLFLTAWRSIQRFSPQRNATRLAFFVALIWAVHPINTQPVNYLIQRCELLMGMFFLSMLYCHTRGVTSNNAWWFAAACLSFWAGAACKEPIWLAPIVVCFFEWLILRSSWTDMWHRRKVWLCYISPSLLLLAFIVPRMLEGAASAGAGTGYTPRMYLVTQSEVIAHYIRLMFWPDQLCFDYDWPMAASLIDVLPEGLLTVGLLLATIFACVLRHWSGFLGIWFFFVLASSSSFIPIADIAVEHRMYLSSISIVVLIVAAVEALSRSRLRPAGLPSEKVVSVTLLILAVCFAGRSYLRNFDYRSATSLWRSVIEIAPENPRAHRMYAFGLLQDGQPEQALQSAYTAVRLPKARVEDQMALGMLFMENGQTPEAIDLLEAVHAKAPNKVKSLYHLGLAYDRAGRLKDAEETLRKAEKRAPHDVSILVSLAAIVADRGQFAESRRLLERVLVQDPVHEKALVNLGVLAAMQGDLNAARLHFKKALKSHPNSQEARLYLDRLKAGPR